MQIFEIRHLTNKCSNFKNLGFLSKHIRSKFPEIVRSSDYLKKIYNFEIIEIDVIHKRIIFQLDFDFIKCPENTESTISIIGHVYLDTSDFYIKQIQHKNLKNTLKKFNLDLTN